MKNTNLSASPLTLERAEAGYSDRAVFSELNLSLQPGEIFGLVGLNGVGKTTLIKTVIDLCPLRAGRIRIFGREHIASGSRSSLAYLPDRFQPPATLLGREFLALTLRAYGLSLDIPAAIVQVRALGLDPTVIARPIRTYSKGMGQKLALAATLLTQRPLVILDEPMTGLDPLARVQLKSALLDYRALGHTLFFSSHILSDIEEICDRVGVFHDGRLLFVGRPSELLAGYGGGSLEQAFLSAIGAGQPRAKAKALAQAQAVAA